jgi:hypothetical protein
MFDYVFHWNKDKDNFNNAHIGYVNSIVNDLNTQGLKHCGMAWGMNRKLYDRIGGLWENNIIGSGDTLIGRSITQKLSDKDILNGQLNYLYSNEYLDQISEYYKLFAGTTYSYLNIPILNGWHGTWESKKYVERHKILKNYHFNSSFLNKKDDGIIHLQDKFTNLIGDIHDYMQNRETSTIYDNQITKIDFYTTFNSKNITSKHTTWKQYANNIYAIQDPSETSDIPECSVIYNPSVEIEGKKLQRVKDIISIAKNKSKYFCIINSDIELGNDIFIWKQIIARVNDGGIVIGQRYNYDKFLENSIENCGFDFFILNNTFEFENDKFLMGLCAWDWYIPYIALKQNISVYNVSKPFIFHKQHDTNWNESLFNLSQDWFYESTSIDRKNKETRIIFNKYLFNKFQNINKIDENNIPDLLDSSNYISKKIQSSQPFAIGKIGISELRCIKNHNDHQKMGVETVWSEETKITTITAGLFPESDESKIQLIEQITDAITNLDALALWNFSEPNFEKEFIQYNNKYCSLLPLRSLEPYYSGLPWSEYLENKNVLVISSFPDTIQLQYKYKHLIWKDPRVLPNFNLITLRYEYSPLINNNISNHNSWLDKLLYMKEQMNNIEYDIALIGAGAASLPLANHAKITGKQSIHLGGALQILFGIMGNRWNNRVIGTSFYNRHWIKPLDHEVPSKYKSIEEGCYW